MLGKISLTLKIVLLLVISSKCFSQTETFDIATYTPPKGWVKTIKEGVVNYSNVNTTSGTFCVIAMYASTASTGDAEKDFNKEWKDLVVVPFGAPANPTSETQATPEGWKLVTGAAPIKMDGIDCYIILNVISGFGKTLSVRTSLNDQSYTAQVDALFASMELDKTKSSTQNNSNTVAAQTNSSGKFGLVLYSTPIGWSEKLYSDGVLFKPLDEPEKEFLSIQIMQPLNASGTLEQALAQSYTEAVAMYNCIYPGTYSKNPSQKSYNGWEYIRGHGGNMIPNGTQFGAQCGLELFVIKVNNRFERVAILDSRTYCNNSLHYSSDRRNYRKSIEQLLFSLHFSDFNGLVLSPGSVKGTGIVGVWQGTMQSTSASALRLEVFSPIFLSNGQVYLGTSVPYEGLDGINSRLPAQLNQRDWGTYTYSNGKGTVNMPYAAIPFRLQGKELIFTKNQTDWPFYQLPSVDGATFNGTYNMSAVNGKIPSISFTSEGNFTDHGALKELYHEYIDCLNPAVTPGSGKYVVQDYSIRFNYNDGRTIALAFLGAEYDKNNPAPPKLRLSYHEDPLIRQ